MRYVVCTILGLGAFAFGLTVFDGGLHELLKIGTCASGGPYVSARPCPSGTERYILSLFGGIVLGLIGLGVWAARGRAPGASASGPGGAVLGAGLLGWCGLFLSAGIVCLVAALRGGLGPGAATGAWIVAGVFIPMGLIPLLAALAALPGRRRRRRADGGAGSAPTAEPPSVGGLPGIPGSLSPGATLEAAPAEASGLPGDAPAPASPRPAARTPAATPDPADQIRELAALRDRGVLSAAEFDAAKRRLLERM